MVGPVPEHIDVGADGARRRIAYLRQEGKTPGVFWLQGFKSDMVSTKATILADWTASEGRSYTRFDYSGHGQSEGDFEAGVLSHWLEEARVVFDALTEGPQIVVGSSMGGHIALLLARQLLRDSAVGRPGRIAGIVLIAPAWDMTEELMWAEASDDVKRAIMEEGVWYRPSQYGEPYAITRDLIEDGRANLLGKEPWNPGCPVEIIHGRLDPDVPFAHSERLVRILNGQAVHLTEVADGEHRLSRPEDLDLMIAKIAKLIATSNGEP